MRRFRRVAVVALCVLSSAAMAAEPCNTTALEGPCRAAASGLRLNDLQVVGTHNSYKRAIPPAELAVIREHSPQDAVELDYAHEPLARQLDMGMRALEIDVVYDPQGGRYARPFLPAFIAERGAGALYDGSAMTQPGFKVLHVPDIDVRSNCATLVLCLREIEAWSDAHPDHVPVLITMNAKDDKSEIPGGVQPLPFDAVAFAALDAEILSVFGPNKLITPDKVRGVHKTLGSAVIAGGWPRLDAARGKVFFALDEGPEKVRLYMRGHVSLEGLPVFVNSISEDAPHAAYFTLNDPIGEGARIRAAVKTGFVVRTRADSGTHEARGNDTARREAAFTSGAQYISTDYPVPRTDFGSYTVVLPNDGPARCNPIRRNTSCGPASR